MVKIDTNFDIDAEEEIEVEFEINPQGVSDHRSLTNRDAEDQHPIKSITGLSEKLSNIDNKLDNIVGEGDLESLKEELNNKANISDIPTKVSQLENDSKFTTEQELNNETQRASARENQLENLINKEQQRAESEESKIIDKQNEIIKNLDSKADKSELENKIEYKDFEYNGEIRKTIQLDNFDSISSVTTEGEGVNLVMLSKWDVADFGSPKIHSNINTKTKFGNASVVTVNDSEALITDKLLQILLTNNGNVKATVNEIEVDGKKFNLYDLNVDLSEYAKTEDLESKANKDEVYSKNEVDNIINSIEHVDAYTKDESDEKFATKIDLNSSIDNINNELKSKADKSELENIVKFEQLTNRKVIKLDKNDALMSDGKLLAFVNDFGVIELGGTNAHTNISTQTKFGDDYIVTINDNAAIVTDKLLKTLFTNNGNVKVTSNSIEVDGKKFNLYDLNVDLSNLATKQELKNKTDYKIVSSNGESLIFNEKSGGGAKFTNTVNKTTHFVGVNDGLDGIDVQIYAKHTPDDKTDPKYNVGSRLNVTTEGIYYTKNKNNASYSEEDEVVTLKDLTEYNLPIASENTLGGIKVGSGLTIDEDGTLHSLGSESESEVTSVNEMKGDVLLTASNIPYNDMTIKEALDQLLYVDPKVNLSINATNFEMGSSNNITLNWTINKDIISQSLNNGVGNLDLNLRTYNFNNVTSNKTYTITINDGKKTASSSKSISFMNKRFWGVSEKQELTTDEIFQLSNELSTTRKQTRTFDCSGGKYFYLIIPTSLCSGISFTIGGLAFSGFDIKTIDITNQYNYTTSYNIYRVNDIQTGSAIKVEVL